MKRHDITITVESNLKEHSKPFNIYIDMEELGKAARYRNFDSVLKEGANKISQDIVKFVCDDLLLRVLKEAVEKGEIRDVHNKENSENV